MRLVERGLDRRVVIEAYARYDCSKKGRTIPDFATWDWSQANGIDEAMRRAELKTGVPAGYLLWDKVELTLSDLRDCAVFAEIFPAQPQKLGLIEEAGQLVRWRCDPARPWCQEIISGHTLDEAAPLLLRPAVKSESPASLYIEDGSGRAITLVANQDKFSCSQTLAIGFLGSKPDRSSAFMQQHFRELLNVVHQE